MFKRRHPCASMSSAALTTCLASSEMICHALDNVKEKLVHFGDTPPITMLAIFSLAGRIAACILKMATTPPFPDFGEGDGGGVKPPPGGKNMHSALWGLTTRRVRTTKLC